MIHTKKLIEVALPLDVINTASARENYIYRGNPSAIHKWWAQRPLSAARAVIFSQMVDDPSAHPEIFKTEKAQEKERQRLFRIIEDLVQWENNANEQVLQKARDEIWQSWRYTCAHNADHPLSKELFDRHKLPGFHDPFAGGGTLPIEAQRLGLESHASDLNPVAVLINKALIEIPPAFADKPPVNPASRGDMSLLVPEWRGGHALAKDVLHYGRWMCEEAAARIGRLYPKIEITQTLARERPDLKRHVGKSLTVIAWIWARTVKSPNPAFAQVDVPLASTFMLSTRAGHEAYVEPIVEKDSYRFTVKAGKPEDSDAAKHGTKPARGSNFRCVMSGAPIAAEYVMAEGKAGRIGARLMAIVAEAEGGRVCLPPTDMMESIAQQAEPEWRPDVEFVQQALGFRIGNYGMTKWSDLFTPRQLVALTTFSDLLGEVRERVKRDAIASGLSDDNVALSVGGSGATAYAEAVSVYLAFAVDKYSVYGNSLVPWYPKELRSMMLFRQHVMSMIWDFTEVNPLSTIGGSLSKSVEIVAGALEGLPQRAPRGDAFQLDARQSAGRPANVVISTDPPYYDNVGYADLSDFFYVWLRRSLKPVFPGLFGTLAVPKAEELVATPCRHGGKDEAATFFLGGMTEAMHRLAEETHPSFPVTIYYAFKQTESGTDIQTASTGWETFLDAVIRANFAITGTWPMRTERTGRMRDANANALASSIVLVCRPRATNAPSATRREFVAALKTELPMALAHLQRGNIAPVDLAQAAIGPGMAVYTRYDKVLDAEGNALPVRAALSLINEILDEALAQQEGDFDADSRWAVTWFEQQGFTEGEYGLAEQLSKSKNTSVAGMVEAGILESKRGKVRLLKPNELPADWDPATDERLTAWEMVHHLIRTLESTGETGASILAAKLGGKAETARELCYRLYTVCERKKRAAEALAYNGLVQSWPEITRLAREGAKPREAQTGLFDGGREE